MSDTEPGRTRTKALFCVAVAISIASYVVEWAMARNRPLALSPWQIALAVIDLALWLVMIALMWRRLNNGRPMGAWDWLAIFVHISCIGFGVGVVPICWIVFRYLEPRDIPLDMPLDDHDDHDDHRDSA